MTTTTTTMPNAAAPPVPDIASAAFKADPLPACARLRTEQPVVRMPVPFAEGHAFVVTRYAEAAAVLRDERFVKNVRTARDPGDLRLPWAPRSLRPLQNSMLDADGADHRRLRSLVQETFSPRYMAQLEPRIESVTADLLDRLDGATDVDLVAAFALPLPLTVIAEIMGVSERDRMRFRRWVGTLLGARPSTRPTLRMLMKLPDVLAMMRLLRRLVAERRADPRDDLISRLAAPDAAGDRLDDDELLAMVFVLLIAGYETTVNLIATGTLLLLRNPDQLARLRSDPGRIGPAVEELLRLACPVDHASERYAREDVEVGGVTIPRGSLVLVGVASANTDGAQFTDAERLDLGRSENRHLSFGLGPHYCLGAPLARLEGRIAIGELVRRFPDLRLAVPPEQLRWRPGILLRGLVSLPVQVAG
ncbi:MAG: cytochrome P450 [Chloroflexi bacterium]|nr:MAG: cytochrome P450 [Chloroflexota bacterium]